MIKTRKTVWTKPNGGLGDQKFGFFLVSARMVCNTGEQLNCNSEDSILILTSD
jgi:hypothetical protein